MSSPSIAEVFGHIMVLYIVHQLTGSSIRVMTNKTK